MTTLIISGHDFRSLRKTSIHFIASDLGRRGPVRFLSVGLSRLSERRGDVRASLAARSNQVELVDGVECFLWRTAWHPFSFRSRLLEPLERAMVRRYRRAVPPTGLNWIGEAGTVLVESGLSAVFIATVRQLNPHARIIYLASDDLRTIGSAAAVQREFRRSFDAIDTVRLPSRHLLGSLPHGRTAILVPHGIDRSLAAVRHPNPYGNRRAGVTLGSMLFDPAVIRAAAAAFPAIDFHLIGARWCRNGRRQPSNVVVHAETAFQQTLGFIQHAAFGIAPYRDAGTPRYLVDTSLKLAQFALFGIPSVCPDFAAGSTPGRFGYVPGEPRSVCRAIEAALAAGTVAGPPRLDWAEVVDRMLRPHCFPDTRLG